MACWWCQKRAEQMLADRKKHIEENKENKDDINKDNITTTWIKDNNGERWK